MARPLRIEFPGAWYHVTNRGAGRRAVFLTDDDRRMFLDLLGEMAERFGVEIHAYSLAGDQYHLLVHTPNGGLGRGMRHLDGVYTQRFNRRHRSDGPLFRGRYRAIVVDPDQKLASVSRYIHVVPKAVGLTDALKTYPWSSFPAYARAVAPPEWLRTEAVLSCFGRKQRRKLYRAYVKDGVDDALQAFYDAKRVPPVLGDADFREKIAKQLMLFQSDRENAALAWLRDRPSIKRIVKTTAETFDVEPKSIYASRRGRGSRNIPRLVAMSLCRSPGGHSLADIAGAFGIGHYASVSVAANRLNELAGADEALAKDVERVRQRLQAKEEKDRGGSKNKGRSKNKSKNKNKNKRKSKVSRHRGGEGA